MPTQFDSFNQEFLNEIDVSGRILSAGIDLFNLFSVGGGTSTPTLSFNDNSLLLSITGSNTVSLSTFSVIEKSPTLRYTNTNILTSITYTNGNTKTLSYTGTLLTQQIYVRPNVTTTYTYNYSINNILTSISLTEIFT